MNNFDDFIVSLRLAAPADSRSKHDLNDVQNEFIERRVQYARCRFPTQICPVQVTLNDVNGSQGGFDISCRIKLILKDQGEVLAGDTDARVEAAIANLAEPAARSLSRQLNRQRQGDVNVEFGSHVTASEDPQRRSTSRLQPESRRLAHCRVSVSCWISL